MVFNVAFKGQNESAIIADRMREADCDLALAILKAVAEDRVRLFQFHHFVNQRGAFLCFPSQQLRGIPMSKKASEFCSLRRTAFCRGDNIGAPPIVLSPENPVN